MGATIVEPACTRNAGSLPVATIVTIVITLAAGGRNMVRSVIVVWERAGTDRGEAGWVVLVNEAGPGNFSSHAWPLVALRRRGDELDWQLPTELLAIAGAATVAAHTGEFVAPASVDVRRSHVVDQEQARASAADWISGMNAEEQADIRRLHSAEQWRDAVRMAEPEASVSDVLVAIERQLGRD